MYALEGISCGSVCAHLPAFERHWQGADLALTGGFPVRGDAVFQYCAYDDAAERDCAQRGDVPGGRRALQPWHRRREREYIEKIKSGVSK